MTPACEAILHDFAASHWLKQALSAALQRDPVDAAADAEVLAAVLRAHCDAVLFASESVGNLRDTLQQGLKEDDDGQ